MNARAIVSRARAFGRLDRSGFTLVELMIVVGLLAILSGFAMNIGTRVGEARRRLQDRMDAKEAAEGALRRWREDVALAGSIAVEKGDRMRVDRRDAQGRALTIAYERDGQGNLVRRAQADGAAAKAKSDILAESIENLRFEPVGRGGWRMTWDAVAGDGIQLWRRPMGGMAAMLAAPGEPQSEAKAHASASAAPMAGREAVR
jgi:prepilin-type N-terminal cleavage/methylation domain-containing protein